MDIIDSDIDLDELLKEIEEEEDSDHEKENNPTKNDNNKIQKNLNIERMKKNTFTKEDINELKNAKKCENNNHNNNDKKRPYTKNKIKIPKNDDDDDESQSLLSNPKKQKTTNDEDDETIIEEDKNRCLFQTIVKEYVRLPLMKRIDQYIDELKKENVHVPLYFDIKEVSTNIDKFTTLEELFQHLSNFNDKDSEKNKAIRHTLTAQYLVYTWLKKNKFLRDENVPISEQDKKCFLKWINNNDHI